LPQPQPRPQQPQQESKGSFWTNPEERIAQLIDQRMGPIMSRTARDEAAGRIQDFAVLEPHIEAMFANADPSIRNNPESWVMAARMARGQLMEQGQYPGNPQGQSHAVQQVPQPRSVPAQQQPPVYSFFSEGPSAPMTGGNFGAGPSGPQAGPEDYDFAKKFQMSIGDYMAWKHGTSGNGGGY